MKGKENLNAMWPLTIDTTRDDTRRDLQRTVTTTVSCARFIRGMTDRAGAPIILSPRVSSYKRMKLTELAFFTDDVKGMTAFYRRLLGAEPVAQSDAMAIFLVGDTKVFIHRNYTLSEGDLPPDNHFALAVDDVDAACRRLVEQGLTLEAPPRDYHWGCSAYLRDPDGHQVEITQAESRSE